MFQASLCLAGADMHGKLTATQVIAKWCWGIKYQAAVRDKFPSFLQAGGFSDQLEIVDVYTEDQFELSVEEQTSPSRNKPKVAFQQFLCEMIPPLFP